MIGAVGVSGARDDESCSTRAREGGGSVEVGVFGSSLNVVSDGDKGSPEVPRWHVPSRTLRANFQASGREGMRHR